LAFGSQGIHGRPAQAEQFLKQAQAVCEKSGDPSARGFTYQGLAWVSVELGKYSESAQFFKQGVAVFEELGNTQGLGNAYLRRGQLAIALGDYAGAIQALWQGIAYFSETQSTLHASHVRIWLGIAYRLQGDYRQAEQISQEVLATFRTMNDPVHAGYCLLNLGCLAQDQGDLPRAEQLQREALELGQRSGQEARIADASRYLGHLMLATGEHRYAEARQYFRQALALATKHQMAPVALDVCVGVAQLLAHIRDLAGAVELLALAEHHEASTFETKQKAHQRLVEFTSQLQPEIAHTAQAQGRTRELWAIVAEIVDALAAEETPASAPANSAAQ
jgi:tetratricopeptide (TPR) repeat protein